jgi:hypothetical protein
MTVEFRYARFGEYTKISRFLDHYWAKNHVYVRMPELFEWTFRRNDLWDEEGYSFVLAEDNGEVIGILGGIPFVFNCLGRTSRAVWFANYMVCPDHRRGPLAIRLLGMFHRPPYRLQVVFGMNPRVAPIYQRLGWNVLESIPRHFMILPHAIERAVRLLRLTHPDWSAERAKVLAGAFRLADITTASVPYTETLPHSWDTIDWPRIAARTVGASRDRQYLTWRYLKHPNFSYRLLTIAEGSRTGLAIWRLEVIRRATPEGLEDVDRIGRLVEFLPASRDNARDLLAVFWNELMKADALGADFYGYHGEIGSWLGEFGFRRVEKTPDGELIPSRFQPLEPKPGAIVSAVIAQDDVPSCSGDSHCVWYWTKSDGDQDRPN